MDTKVESKYERLRKIGIGSYGVVFKCVNRQSGQVVAIKRYSENDTDPIIRKIAMREVRVLRQLKHPNLIRLIEVFRRKKRLHLVFDYCELTVLDVIEKYGSNCSSNLIKKIIWQTVNGLNYCHANNFIHRDIKPENILINQAGVVKLCDFGFARSLNSLNRSRTRPSCAIDKMSKISEVIANKENSTSDRQLLTEYVATRWYRAPELLIGDPHYNTKIDIWAIGCVTAELMRGEPLWPGKTDFDQLSMIISSIGPLTNEQVETLQTKSIYDQILVKRLLAQLNSNNPDKSQLSSRMPANIGQAGVEFVISCLLMNPTRRPTSAELLKHEYIYSVRMEQFVKSASRSGPPPASAESLRSPKSSTLSVQKRLQIASKSTNNQHISNVKSNSQLMLMATGTLSKRAEHDQPQQQPKQQQSQQQKQVRRTVISKSNKKPS